MSTNNKESSISSIFDIEERHEVDSNASWDVTDGVCSRITGSNFTIQFCIPKLQDPSIQKKQVSIDVTKALLVLGFASWSGLEDGKYQ